LQPALVVAGRRIERRPAAGVAELRLNWQPAGREVQRQPSRATERGAAAWRKIAARWGSGRSVILWPDCCCGCAMGSAVSGRREIPSSTTERAFHQNQATRAPPTSSKRESSEEGKV
jgi:hypothetical protein